STDMHTVLSFFFSSRRRHTISKRDWSSDVCSSDLLWIIIVLYISIVITICKMIYMVVIYPSLLQTSWTYQMDEAFIQERHGVLHSHHIVIPTSHVQAVHISKLKKFDLANIIIQAKTTTIHIPAVPLSEAEQLKKKIDTLS